MTIAIVAALSEEIAPLLRRLHGAPRALPPGRRYRGRLGGREVLLMATGDGELAARRSLESLFEAVRPELLIGLGCAGALTPDLCPGDLLAAERVVEESTGREFRPPAGERLGRVRTRAAPRDGTIVTARAIAVTAPEKARLARLARTAPAVVDLESSAWVAVATAAGVPWLLARGVADGHDEDLPLDFERLRDAAGSVDRRRVLLAAWRRPRCWSGLLRLRRRLRAVSEDLASWAAAVASA